jgi:hypothetical protein
MEPSAIRRRWRSRPSRLSKLREKSRSERGGSFRSPCIYRPKYAGEGSPDCDTGQEGTHGPNKNPMKDLDTRQNALRKSDRNWQAAAAGWNVHFACPPNASDLQRHPNLRYYKRAPGEQRKADNQSLPVEEPALSRVSGSRTLHRHGALPDRRSDLLGQILKHCLAIRRN